ncbi:MAG: hypothetical protein GTN69_10630 [Armatimonadetes bacterium]|nr:hypothetical protein [Armatimonadota bacterium]
MTEHPMIFQPESVRGLLAKPPTKWQTRRVATAQNSLINGSGEWIRSDWQYLDWSKARVDIGPSPAGNPGPYFHVPFRRPDYGDDCPIYRVYPRVQPGDLVRIRETWRPVMEGYHSYIEYKACSPDLQVLDAREKFKNLKAIYHVVPGGSSLPSYSKAWHSPLHLPREWSRAWLRVSGVRGQRLQDISEEDAKAEGARLLYWYAPTADEDTHVTLSGANASHLNGFATQWTSINRKKPSRRWEANPIVWAYSVDRVLNRVEADEYLREAV